METYHYQNMKQVRLSRVQKINNTELKLSAVVIHRDN